MTRCVEFYDYWDQHPDFCGKSPATVSYINSYAKVLNELKELGVEKSFTIVNFPEGNARPIFPLKDPIRNTVLKNVASWLLTNRKPSVADVKAWTSLYNGKRPECKEPEPCKLKPENPVVNGCKDFSNIMRGCGRDPKTICQMSLDQRKQKGCHLEGMQPPNGGRQTGPKEVDPATVATIAGVSPEQVRPHDKTGPFTPANEIPKGLVDLNTPDTRTDPKPFVPVHPITRTDPLDKACGVVKMQAKTTDYETLAKEGDMYPITKRTAQTINQMVEYGISPDNLDAHALIEKDGYDHYLEQIEVFLKKEEEADSEAIA